MNESFFVSISSAQVELKCCSLIKDVTHLGYMDYELGEWFVDKHGSMYIV